MPVIRCDIQSARFLMPYLLQCVISTGSSDSRKGDPTPVLTPFLTPSQPPSQPPLQSLFSNRTSAEFLTMGEAAQGLWEQVACLSYQLGFTIGQEYDPSPMHFPIVIL